MKRKNLYAILFLVIIVSIAFVLSGGLAGFSHDVSTPNVKKYQKIKTFAEVMSIVEHNYVHKVGSDKLITDALKGMVSSLDPHSSYMTKEDYKELETSMKGKFGGLGIRISMVNGLLTIISPIDDTPAYRAGLKAKDVILKINGKSTMGMSMQDAVNIMRGKPGTKVTLTIMRQNSKKPFDVTITRAIIKIKSVKFKVIDNVGYVRISQFQSGTADELKSALKKLTNKHIVGIVLDLRNNPGGLLSQAVDVCNLFIKKGVIVSIKGRNSMENRTFYATGDVKFNKPIVVLINSGSASAAEIVTGCLKDNRRAVIMGERSFGKGSVQSIIPLPDGSALRLTTAEYYTPNDISIQAKGIEPNIVVPQALIKPEKEGFSIRESDLSHHLSADKNNKEKIKKVVPLEFNKGIGNDYQLLRAIELIKAEKFICTKKQQ